MAIGQLSKRGTHPWVSSPFSFYPLISRMTRILFFNNNQPRGRTEKACNERSKGKFSILFLHQPRRQLFHRRWLLLLRLLLFRHNHVSFLI